MNKKTTLIFSLAVAFILVLSLPALLQAEEEIKCPVSGKTFNKSDDSESHVYKGKTYYFCCPGCKEKFDKEPEKYVKDNGEPVICPVMGNEVKDLEKADNYEYKGKTYYFCCPGCIDKFKADPEKYIK